MDPRSTLAPLALLGGAPVRESFPQPRPRLLPHEAARAAAVFSAPEWSRIGACAPLPSLDKLEREWARLHECAAAVAVSSGTAALTLVLRALRIPPGDEVLLPAYGCPAVDVAVLAAGLTPLHVDIDASTYCISPSGAAAALTGRTAALIAVHFAGDPAPLRSLHTLAERHGIALIEDACLAPGARYSGRSVGSWGQAGVFSLGVRKPLSAGEGGLIATNNLALAERLRQLRDLGVDSDTGELAEATGNCRLTELQAAVVLPQLARLETDRVRRAETARRLGAILEACPAFRLLRQDPQGVSAAAQLWARYDETSTGVRRDRLVEAVHAEGIPLFTGWPRPNYTHPVYTAPRAAAWLAARNSGREPDHYERTRAPHAEHAAYNEAVLFDFPVLDAEESVLQDVEAGLQKVIRNLDALREVRSEK